MMEIGDRVRLVKADHPDDKKDIGRLGVVTGFYGRMTEVVLDGDDPGEQAYAYYDSELELFVEYDGVRL